MLSDFREGVDLLDDLLRRLTRKQRKLLGALVAEGDEVLDRSALQPVFPSSLAELRLKVGGSMSSLEDTVHELREIGMVSWDSEEARETVTSRGRDEEQIDTLYMLREVGEHLGLDAAQLIARPGILDLT